MDSLVGYGSEDEHDSEYFAERSSVEPNRVGGARRRDDDTNYDDVNMDMSEDSQEAESEPELPPAEPTSSKQTLREDHRSYNDSRNDRDHDRRERRRDSPRERSDKRRDSPRRDDKYRSDRSDRGREAMRDRGNEGSSKRGLLGDKPDDKASDSKQVPALMDLKPFGGDPPPGYRSQDARDAASPRFVERDRRDRDRERDRDRHSRRDHERRSGRERHSDRERRSRSRGAYPPATSTSTSERRASPPSSSDYRPSSYKVNKKLEVMEKMGLQIKTPDGSMTTAQQLRAASGDVPAHAPLPSYYNPSAVNTSKILDQVQKRKLLWSNKNKTEAEEAAKWSGTRFAQDNDGKQVSKFMRLMGIKEPGALKPEPVDETVDPIKKQEELFQAMQAQYEVARATTHTMRGVGLGFQRGQY